jgi:type I restriction enzyme, S subunit
MMSRWQKKKLSEVTNKIGSGATPRGGEDSYKESGIPLIRSLNVHDRVFKKKNLAFIDENQASKLSNVIVQQGDVLLNITGASIARCCVAPEEILPARVNQHVAIIRPRTDCINTYFLAYLLISKEYKDSLLNTGEKAGSTRQALTKLQLQDFEIPLPSISEQRRIVSIVDEAFEGIDRAIVNTEKNLANAHELFESYLNDTFATKKDGWLNKKLEDICLIKHGFAFKGEFFTNEESGYILLTPGSFHECGGYREQGEKTKYYIGDIPQGYILKTGDLLFAMTEQAVGLLGSSLIVPESNRFLHNQRLGLIQVHPGVSWHNEFFFHQFNTQKFRASVQSSASGVKVRHTSPGKLGAISVVFPATIDEQTVIANNLNRLAIETQSLATIYQRKITVLNELKQSILQKAFAGELTADTVSQTKKTTREAISA